MLVWITMTLVLMGNGQTLPFWYIPSSGLQINTISLIVNGYLPQSPKLTQITFQFPFQNPPSLTLTLSSIKTISSSLTLYQESPTITLTSFIHKLTLTDAAHTVQSLKICYCAVDLFKFYYFYSHTLLVPLNILSQEVQGQLASEYVPVRYLSALEPNNTYELAVMLTGFQAESSTPFKLAIKSEFDTPQQYILKIQTINAKILRIQVSRILIDKTAQNLQNLTLHTTKIQTANVKFNSDSTKDYFPYPLYFYGEATLYGVMDFQGGFQCKEGASVHQVPLGGVRFVTGYVVFKEYTCADNTVWELTSSTCYPRTSPRIYQVDLQFYQFCFMACYQCTGPLLSDCQSYLPQQATIPPTNTTIECRPTYATTHITHHCILCSAFVLGCDRCLYNGTCLACHPNCTFVNSTFCDCRPMCQTNLEFIYPHSGVCQCLPQYYRVGNGGCQRCVEGCYTCKDSATNCQSCINGYQLQGSSCLNYIYSNYMIDNNIGTQNSLDRCIQYIDSSCLQMCPEQSFMYAQNCYLYECPISYFPFLEMATNMRMCQPCPANCYDCDNYYTCKKCIDQSFYLNGTGYCVGCAVGCAKCLTGGCSACYPGYNFNSSTKVCSQDIPQAPTSCPQGCSKCSLQTYCESCSTGYYRNRNNEQCQQCTGPGLITKYQLQDGVVSLQCEEICGDGLLLMTGCDDGNVVGGDGCSQECQVQEGFLCQGFGKGSLCVKVGYQMNCTYEKNLTSDQLNITIVWEAGTQLLFDYVCSPNLTVVSWHQTPNSTTYTIIYPNTTAQSKTCNFSIPSSTLIPNTLTCNISTSPPSLHTLPLNPLLLNTQQLFNTISKPLAYSLWIIAVLGFDPYDILINHSFVYLYLGSLYDFDQQVANGYGMFGGLRFWGFYWGEEEGMGVFGEFVAAVWRSLGFMLVLVVYHEGVVRFLKNQKLFTQTQVKIFKNVFHNRFTLYSTTYTSMLPTTALYLTLITLPSLTTPQSNILPLILTTLHILFYLTTTILLLIFSNRITQIQGHVKYIFVLVFIQEIAAIRVIGVVGGQIGVGVGGGGGGRDWIGLGGFLEAVGVFLGLVYVLGDYSPQIRDQEVEDQYWNQQYRAVINKISRRTGNAHSQNPPKSPNSLQSWNDSKQNLRKLNITIQSCCYISIICLKSIYFYTTDQNKQIYGICINAIFFYGILCTGFVLNFVSQAVTVGIYGKVEVPEEQVDGDGDGQGDRDGERGEQRGELRQQGGKFGGRGDGRDGNQMSISQFSQHHREQ